jgi:antitoxin HicB
MNNKHLGSSFDDFLQREQLLGGAEAAALKRVIAFQIAQEMERRDFTKAEMARRMKTSRASLERLLDPTHSSVTLATLERAATVLGKKLKIELA